MSTFYANPMRLAAFGAAGQWIGALAWHSMILLREHQRRFFNSGPPRLSACRIWQGGRCDDPDRRRPHWDCPYRLDPECRAGIGSVIGTCRQDEEIEWVEVSEQPGVKTVEHLARAERRAIGIVVLRLPTRPAHRRAREHDRPGAPVVADRQVSPVWEQRFAVRAEDPRHFFAGRLPGKRTTYVVLRAGANTASTPRWLPSAWQ